MPPDVKVRGNGDGDAAETREWLDSLDGVLQHEGAERARFLLTQLEAQGASQRRRDPVHRQHALHQHHPRRPAAAFPGNREIERRIKSLIRWNAMAMVVRANKHDAGHRRPHLHLSPRRPRCYEVGFNHFFHGPDAPGGGDLVYFQGHASPGIYARAFLEGRLNDEHLENFRRELARRRRPVVVSASLADARFLAVPDRVDGPGADHGHLPGALQALPGASRPEGHLAAARLGFLGDGETDEPESLGALTLASREKLDNLIFVVNCNLQRLDGPVRGNGKIIQELEAAFRGAGWNVIKVIWGSDWDALLAQDNDGLLVKRMDEVVDGEYQKFTVEPGAYIRKHFFGKYPELLEAGRAPVRRAAAQAAPRRPRSGEGLRRLQGRRRAPGLADRHPGQDGQGLRPGRSRRRPQHHPSAEEAQRGGADRVPHAASAFRSPTRTWHEAPFYKPPEDSQEMQYLRERRQGAGRLSAGPCVHVPAAQGAAAASCSSEFFKGSGDSEVSTTMAFVGLLNKLLQRQGDRQAGRADHSRRGPHLRHGSAVPPVRHLCQRRPALRAGRCQDAARLPRGQERPDPGRRHHRSRGDVVVHRRRHRLCHPRHPDDPVLHLLFDVRLPARSAI